VTTTPKTWAAGLVAVSDLQTYVSTIETELQALNALETAGAISTATGTLTSGTTAQEVACGSTEKLSGITATSGRLVMPNTGWYNVTVQIGFAASATGVRALFLGVNVAAVSKITVLGNAAASGQTYLNGAASVYCTAGDTLSVFGYQSSGSTMTSNIVARISALYGLSA
jgi:hypothetical protein